MRAKSLIIQTQTDDSGYQQAASQDNHPIRKKEFDDAFSQLDELAHVILTVEDTQSVDLDLSGEGGQHLKANVRLHTSPGAGKGLLGTDTEGLYAQIGSGSQQLASGAVVAALQTTVTSLSGELDDKADTNHRHDNATVEADGFLPKEDKAKLNAITIKAMVQAKTDLPLSSNTVSDLRWVINDRNWYRCKAITGVVDDQWESLYPVHTHPVATTDADGFFAKEDKSKLNGIPVKASVQAKTDLPVANNVIGDLRWVANDRNWYRCKAITGAVDDQWEISTPAAHTHPLATTTDPGFFSPDEKAQLAALQANTQWRASVATPADLPLNVDTLGSCRLVRSNWMIYRCISTVGFLNDQWQPQGSVKYAATVGNGVATAITVTHNLGTEDVGVNVREATGAKNALGVDWKVVDANRVQLNFSEAPLSGGLRVVVFG